MEKAEKGRVVTVNVVLRTSDMGLTLRIRTSSGRCQHRAGLGSNPDRNREEVSPDQEVGLGIMNISFRERDKGDPGAQ